MDLRMVRPGVVTMTEADMMVPLADLGVRLVESAHPDLRTDQVLRTGDDQSGRVCSEVEQDRALAGIRVLHPHGGHEAKLPGMAWYPPIGVPR